MNATPHISHEAHHRALVRQLLSKVRPSRQLWPVSVRLRLWIVMEVGILAWVMNHTTNNFVAKMADPAYWRRSIHLWMEGSDLPVLFRRGPGAVQG